jgi:hypothetical protein
MDWIIVAIGISGLAIMAVAIAGFAKLARGHRSE